MFKAALFAICVAALSAGCAQKPERFGYETPRKLQLNCLTHTGSHIKRRKQECVIGPGNAYGRNAVVGAGATSTAGAIAGLDPSVRIGGN